MVLIIDDDQSVRILTERLVKTFGYAPISASTGEEGLKLFAAHTAEVGVVVLDLTMPDLNGEETFKRLREMCPALPVIFTSGYDKGDEVVKDSRTEFLQKPFKRDELRNKLGKYMAQKSAAA
jgi:two-component system cell cycle sensor histidine kinase/response regulator CckA